MTQKDLENNIYINQNDIQNVNLDFFDQYYPNNSWVKQDNEHYKLLKYLANQYNNTCILDIGTREGCSCLALAQNPTNQIISYDILNCVLPYSLPNVTFKRKNIFFEDNSVLNNAPLMLLDIDPHDGYQETLFINQLKSINYNGIIICDDIYKMPQWWNGIDVEKYDITYVGHFSGTGLINFSKKKVVFQ